MRDRAHPFNIRCTPLRATAEVTPDAAAPSAGTSSTNASLPFAATVLTAPHSWTPRRHPCRRDRPTPRVLLSPPSDQHAASALVCLPSCASSARRVTLALPARPVLAWRGSWRRAQWPDVRRVWGVRSRMRLRVRPACRGVRAIVVSSQARHAGGAGPVQQPSGRPLRASDERVQKPRAGRPGPPPRSPGRVVAAAVRCRCQASAAWNGRTSIGFLVAAEAFDAHTRAASRSSAWMM